ncbi:dTDP-4-amino-4,6-dideoxy-D-glucose transaminase [Coriobacteriaceae bacterium CHKCI002]|nr:dTDP-4-amino-4,6-dideoxy-D-glucose transaminase [Coriobacteriaceae bacterium CHKCI002]
MEYNIPVTRSTMPSFEEYTEEIAELWETRWLTNSGTKHIEFESRLEAYLGVSHVSLFANGHLALESTFKAMGLEGKVITTPFTFASTVHAIVRAGLTPVFADIKYDNYTIDPARIEELVDEDTCAIVPVHVYGNLCDVDAIQAIANRHGLKVIYDAAHAFGVRRDGVSAASYGDASMFSFHATKVFNTIEGGAVSCDSMDLAEELALQKNFGIVNPETVQCVGGNAKMNEFCAAMGLCNLRHLDDAISKRKAVADRYFELLGDMRGLKLVMPPCNVDHNYAYLPVVFEDGFGSTRDQVFDVLALSGIHARKYFYPLVSDFDCYCSEYDSAATPIAACVANRVLTLPLYSDLPIEMVDAICGLVKGEAERSFVSN